ncbi:M4 family metallopeptidase [Flavobacterium ponti]|jgi:Zn-dependent metalloprotease|uniref:M4 family metallopeptidase n=1 Tax=Flavobacterium ponti TaxID=665133 RepID=A0ABV9P1J8_9FLAO
MKTKLLSLLMLLTSIVFFGQKDNSQEAKPHQKTLKINTINTNQEAAIKLFSKEYNLNENYSYTKLYSNSDERGLKHEKFQQFYKNIKVEFGTVITHINNEGVYFVNGELYNANQLNITPTISSQQGFSNALQNINATKYMWEDAEQANLMEYKKPEGELVIFPNVVNNEIHLAYKYDIYSIIPVTRQEVYVDAHTGEILFSNSIIKHANTINATKKLNKPFSKKNKVTNLAQGTAATRYSGSREIETTLLGSNYVLQDATRGNGIKTYNCQKGGYQDVDFMDNDNNWTAAEYNNANKDNGALDAHWGAEKTYDFWNNVYNRNSYDNNGAIIKSYVHYDVNFNNAFWNGVAMTYGDGSGSGDILTSIDVCGHEIGHAICTYTAGLVYQNQSGAMNEGFSDIWGACIEHYGRTGGLTATIPNAVWLIGEDLGNAFRSMSNPNSKNDPDTYLGTFWYSGTADNGGVHTNSGVLNHWFYILTVGESGTNNAPTPDTYNVAGIGMNKASEIAYIAERDYLTPNATYADARVATIEAASSIYCANSPEVIAVTNAWYAVNVGEQYATVSDDVALQTITNVSTISCGDGLSPILSLKNQGLNNITSISISYTIDGGTAINQTWNGNLAPCNETTLALSISGLSRGSHVLDVTSTIVNDGRPENNTKSVLLLVNDTGLVGTVNPFTNPSDALITYNQNESTSIWVRGVRTFGPMSSAGNTVYTTNLTGNYVNQKKSYIVSQCYNLTNVSNPQISFAMKFDLEQDWDIVYVQYTTDMGQNWSVLGQMDTNWYNSDRTPQTSGDDCNNCVGAQWTGTDTTLKTYSYPLTSLVGEPNVIFRIVFHSDEAVVQQGVNIDDFVINGVLANENFELNDVSVYPNPSNGIYNISLGKVNPDLIEVYDLTGKIILSKKEIIPSNFETIIDLSSASQGVYFVKIVEDDQQVVKRIIKQ